MKKSTKLTIAAILAVGTSAIAAEVNTNAVVEVQLSAEAERELVISTAAAQFAAPEMAAREAKYQEYLVMKEKVDKIRDAAKKENDEKITAITAIDASEAVMIENGDGNILTKVFGKIPFFGKKVDTDARNTLAGFEKSRKSEIKDSKEADKKLAKAEKLEAELIDQLDKLSIEASKKNRIGRSLKETELTLKELVVNDVEAREVSALKLKPKKVKGAMVQAGYDMGGRRVPIATSYETKLEVPAPREL